MLQERRIPRQRRQLALFAKNFFQHPRMLGSIFPSSRFLTARLLGKVDWARAGVVVEYGPGVGTFTREILRHMRPDAVLIAIETNPEFVGFLRDSIDDPRFTIVHGSAAEAARILEERRIEQADYVIAGIPFSTIPDRERTSILRTTHGILGETGAFVLYQFSPKVAGDLQRIFSHVSRSFEPLNVLPAQIFYCAP